MRRPEGVGTRPRSAMSSDVNHPARGVQQEHAAGGPRYGAKPVCSTKRGLRGVEVAGCAEDPDSGSARPMPQ
jgi:hypothetical protein